ncbi:MAC/perforin domain-containing protein [Mucilaginibacter sp. P25]|uniref:MAC/Perforin domain-containing protein n=1 Tax=Mucilaginibacter gossypii TaxID=551996 RepID=A0A1G7R571_9SPHI|nr:MAC/perforin domain-containing protein [Mucilaginibacter gossypii]SDG05309.1 MAC/Perforin domain-containing protein [Mucilaginibacter gossypii]
MKKNLFIISLMMMLWSCSKNAQLVPDQTKTSSGKLTAHAAGDQAWDVLGFGYDVTGEYGNSVSTTFPVIDVAKLYAADPIRVVKNVSTSRNSTFSYGDNVQHYSSDLSAHLNATVGFSLFKASITSAYSDVSSFNSKYIYGSYNLLLQQRELKFNAPTVILQQYLTSNFKTDIGILTPEQLVRQYGAFFLTDIMLGAKLQITYRSQTSSSDRKTAASAGLDQSLGSLFSINAGINSQHSQSSSNFNQYVHYVTHGGDPTVGITPNTIVFDQNTPPIDFGAWQSTTNAQNAVLIDIPSSGLIGIYDLIADPVKSKAVKDYINNVFLPGNQVQAVFDKAPLYRCFSTANQDYMILTNPSEVSNLPSWKIEGVLGNVYTDNTKGGLVPVLRWYQYQAGYHFFTCNVNEIPSQANQEGTQGYINPTQVPGSKPLYRYRNSRGAHCYSVDVNELGPKNGWTLDGIMGYLE